MPPSPLVHRIRSLLAPLLLLAALLAAWPATAGEQAERALAAVRRLVAAGEIAPGATLRLSFKQGNVNAFLGRELELQNEWERRTGILLNAHIIPQQPVLQMLRATPAIDLTVARNHEYPDLLAEDLIEDLTPLFAEFGFRLEETSRDGFIRPHLQAQVGERTVAIPADGDVAILYLRRDLMNDPKEKTAFRAAFGRPLAPPRTWDEYAELVRFFHRPEQGLYGAAEERDPDGAWMYWLPRYLPQAAPWQPLFDARMHPLLDSPAGIAATESYVATMRHSAPGATEADKGYNFTLPLFAQGKAFATIVTIAAARVLNAEGSPLRGRFMAVPMPGVLHGERLVRRTTVIYGNNLVIPRTATNPRLAFLYAMWLTDPDVSARSIVVPGGFADPYRWSHVRDPRIAGVYGTASLEVFVREWNFALPPGTGLPGDGEYLAALDRNLTAAARGESTPQQAMAATARAWEAITERYGREAQIRHWLAFTAGFEVAQ